jgi:protoporphyrinogen oxidase
VKPSEPTFQAQVMATGKSIPSKPPPVDASLHGLRVRNREAMHRAGQPSALPHVVVLGAGPAGVGAAFQLTRRNVARVTVLEQRDTVGGNAGSFELEGIRADYGSHRLHPACDSEILEDLRELLGSDLLVRPRHGRIRLQGRWLHFPLKPLDLLVHLSPRFSLGVAMDIVRKVLPRSERHPATFATVLERSLGATICREFYFPYARKLWGLLPEELAVTQARRRVSANSIPKMLRKILSNLPGLRAPMTGRFYYPRRGYGQISERLCEAAQAAGAEFKFGSRVTAMERRDDGAIAVHYQQGGAEHVVTTAHLWSTLPITLLARGMRPSPPAEVLQAASGIDYRAMILIYLVLEQDRFTEYDAHYFPEEAIPISRLSEPKNYCAAAEPRGLTLLCAELPTDPTSPEWTMSDDELGNRLREWLGQAGLPVRAPVRRAVARRLKQAYPVYARGYETHFAMLDTWVSGLPGVLTFGRQGLFAHDNTHHALYMAYAAVECFDVNGDFNWELWREFRKVFETHVVED